MKRVLFNAVLTLMVCTVSVTSCGNRRVETSKAGHYDSDEVAVGVKSALQLKKYEFDKENKYGKVEIDVECPTGDDVVSSNIRQDLLSILNKAVNMNEDYGMISASKGDKPDMKDAVESYGNLLYDKVCDQSKEDNKMRNDTEKQIAKEEGRDYEKIDVMQYFYEVEIDREWEDKNYCVFDAEIETFNGGAHGSSIDLGGLTYSKKDGKRFTDFIKPASEKEMQKLLRVGLVSYFVKEGQAVDDAGLNDMLQLDGNLIPLPKETPHPTAQGLVFRYGQYEIAPYAAGKPKFCVPYAKIKPFLTAEAIELLGL